MKKTDVPRSIPTREKHRKKTYNRSLVLRYTACQINPSAANMQLFLVLRKCPPTAVKTIDIYPVCILSTDNLRKHV